MTPERIKELVRKVPDNFPFYTGMGRSSDSRSLYLSRVSFALKDPQFAYVFVMAFVQMEQPLPMCVHEHHLHRAYKYERYGASYPALEEAKIWREPNNSHTRGMIHQRLVYIHSSLEEAAQQLNMPIDMLTCYEQFFFNVRDRFNDKQYIEHLVFPHTRRVVYEHDYFLKETPAMLALRAAYDAPKDLFPGDKIYFRSEDTVKTAAFYGEQTERAIMRGADDAIALGAVNQTMPVIINAKAILVAEKQNQDHERNTTDSQMGLEALEMTPNDSISSTVAGSLRDSDFSERERMQNLKSAGSS